MFFISQKYFYMTIIKNLLLLFIITLSPSLLAEWATGTGESLIHPDITETEACLMAKRKAKEKAIEAVTGINFSSKGYQICSEENLAEDPSEGACRLISTLISVTRGLIIETQNEVKKITERNNLRYCSYSIDADVVKRGNPNPSFDFDVKLNSSYYKHGDPMRISISPGLPMYISMFVLSLEASENQLVSLLYPQYSSEQKTKKIRKQTVYPTNENFQYTVEFPKYSSKQRVAEILAITATEEPVSFYKKAFTEAEFNAKINEIDSSKIRVKYVPFYIYKN